MRRAPAVALAGLVAGGCGGDGGGSSEQDAVLAVMERGRASLLAGRADEACALLTANGRRQALAFADTSGRRPPRTCEAVVRRELALERAPDVGPSWSPDLRRSRFVVRSVDGARARVDLKVRKPYGPVLRFSLRKVGGAWRIDDSDAVPVGD